MKIWDFKRTRSFGESGEYGARELLENMELKGFKRTWS